MDRIELSDVEAVTGLRMMKTIALADGALSEKEITLIDAAALAIGRRCDPRTLEPITADEVARALGSAVLRERAVQAAIVVALIDGEATLAEAAAIESFARALEVDEPRLRNLRQLASGHIRSMWLDPARRSFARPIFEQALRKHGLAGVYKIVAPMVGLGRDPDLTRRYDDLGKLPEVCIPQAPACRAIVAFYRLARTVSVVAAAADLGRGMA
jgi:tellurite resistance protein